ncbi:caspase family protein [Puniceicoccaceae bacterium K14]|nr:caspase family protein [Puniceicoccaceae bacterium K14]
MTLPIIKTHRILSSTFALLVATLATSLHAIWQISPNTPLEQSPNGSFVIVPQTQDYANTGFTLHNRESLSAAYVVRQPDARPRLFSADQTKLYFTVYSEGLFTLDLETGSIRQLAALPNILALMMNDATGSVSVLSSLPNTDAQILHSIDASGNHPPEVLAKFTADAHPSNEFLGILPSSKLAHALIITREYGPPPSQWESTVMGDFRFTEISLATGETTNFSRLTAPSDSFHLLDNYRWTNDQHTLLEIGNGPYYQLDPYVGKITRTLDLPGVKFRLYPGRQVVALRTVTEEGETRHYQDFLQSGTLKTIRNLLVNEPGVWPDRAPKLLETLDLKEFPSPITYTNYAFHPSKPEFFATDSDENVYFFRAARSGLKRQNRGSGADTVRYTPDGDSVLFERLFDPVTEQTKAANFPAPGSLAYQDPPLRTPDPVYTADHQFSPDGQWLIKINNRDATLHRFGEAKIVSYLGGVKGGFDAPLPKYRFSTDQTRLFRIIRHLSWDEYDNLVINHQLEAIPFDPSNEYPEPIWTVDIPHSDLIWLDETVFSYIQLLDTSSGELLRLDPESGQLSSLKITGFDTANFTNGFDAVSTNVIWNADSTKAYVASGPQVTSLDFTNNTPKASSTKLPSGAQKLHRYGDGRHLIAQLKTGPLVFLDTKTDSLSMALHLEFYDLASGNYLAFTPVGKFDASSALLQTGQLLQGTRPIPLPSIIERNFEPDLLSTALGPDAVAADNQLAAYIQPPSISVSEQWVSALERRIRIATESKQHPIANVSIYQNEKLVLTFTPTEKHSIRESPVISLLLEQNRFKVVSTNTAGVSVTSQEIIIDPPEALIREKIAARRPPILHLLAVGIDKYRNTEYNLNFAEADAASVLEKIKTANTNLFADIKVHHLESANATHDNILTAFESIRTDAHPHDAFVFYFAGHGVMSSSDSQFYLIPHDVTRIYGASQSLTQNGISANQLRDLSAGIKAQKQLFLLDACNSGGALQAFAQRGASQEKALAQLARATGTHWIAASSANQFATEFADLGHGAFTHTLLQALGGAADTGDQRITINELKAYLESELPTITQKYKGTPQYPTSYGHGQDFPIAIVP